MLCATFVTMLYLKPKSVSEDFVYRSPPPCSLRFQPTGKTENPPAVNRSGSSLPCQGGGLISSFPSLRLVWAQRARNLAVARSAAAGGCWLGLALRSTCSRLARRAARLGPSMLGITSASSVCMCLGRRAFVPGFTLWGYPRDQPGARTPPRLNLIPRRD